MGWILSLTQSYKNLLDVYGGWIRPKSNFTIIDFKWLSTIKDVDFKPKSIKWTCKMRFVSTYIL